MTDPVPPWKFWHPLKLWHVFLIALVMEIVCTMPIVAMRELWKVDIPTWVGSGIGGALMFLVIRMFAQRRLAAMQKEQAGSGA